MDHDEILAEVGEAHLIKTHSSTRHGVVTRDAGCTCGAEFAWNDRDAEHREHLFGAIFEAGFAAGKAAS